VWPDEIEKWSEFSDITYTILHGPAKKQNLKLDVDIYLINPEGLLWLFAHGEQRQNWDILIIDESTKFKDSTTKRFKLLKPFIPQFSRRWILTGTPSPNGLEDLFGQIYILDTGRALGKYITHYRMQFFERAGFNLYEWKPRSGAFQEVTDKIKPLVIQLSAEDYLEMPELVFRDIKVTLPPSVKKQYDEVEEVFLTRLEEADIVAANAAVAGIKCRQMANGAVYDAERNVISIHEEKLDALEDFIEELSGKPLLILYEFDHDRQRILSRLGDIPVLGHGLNPRTLEAIIDGFNAGNLRCLLGHPASMGHGLNLQGSCHHIIWFGITWNLEFYDQAIARIYRQGQKQDKVYVYHIVAKDTLDERVLQTLTSKDKTQQTLLRALHRD
jgi:SNF2 family DNA or RNA helicase